MKSQWKIAQISGGKPVVNASTYSFDNKYFIQAFSSSLKVYYIATRQCIRTLSYLKLESAIASRIDPLNPSLVWFFAPEKVTVVNWREKNVEPVVFESQIKDLLHIIEVVDFRFNYSLNSYELMGLKGKVSKHGGAHKRVLFKAQMKYGLPISANNGPVTLDFTNMEYSQQSLLEVKKVTAYAVSHNSKALVFVSEEEIFLVELKSFAIANKNSVTMKEKPVIASVAVSTKGLVALGYVNGVIEVLYNFAVTQESVKTLKWHLDSVSTLCFTKDDNYLISGGKEKVLVFWQLASDKVQYLPRLNGPILKVSANPLVSEIDSTQARENDGNDYYKVVLQVENNPNKEYEVVIINSVDLTSRLAILSHHLNTTTAISNVHKEIKKLEKSEGAHKLKNDYALKGNVEINSLDHNLYTINGSELQIYNLIKDEQHSTLNVVPKVSLGKIKKETNLKDPKITTFKFTADGVWLATADEQETPNVDNVVTQGESAFCLKFWRKSNDASKSWELATKIVDPHGSKIAISKIIPAPMSYNNGAAFITVDNRGGVRLWRPQPTNLPYNGASPASSSSFAAKSHTTAWTLRRFISSIISKDIYGEACVEWSSDFSLILVSLGNTIYKIPFANFDDWDYLSFDKQLVNSKSIKGLKFINGDSNLLVLSDEYLINYDLINDSIKYQYKSQFSLSDKLLTFDDAAEKFTICANFINNGDPSCVLCTFNYSKSEPLSVYIYNHLVCCVKWIESSDYCLVLDAEYNIGLFKKDDFGSEMVNMSSVWSNVDTSVDSTDIINEMVTLVKNSKSVKISPAENGDIDSEDSIMIDGDLYGGKKINNHTFESLLSTDLQGLRIEELFDKVVECL